MNKQLRLTKAASEQHRSLQTNKPRPIQRSAKRRFCKEIQMVHTQALAPSLPTLNDTAGGRDLDSIVDRYDLRSRAIDLITQYHHLIKDIQRHRGITMGLLAGDNEYRSEFSALQRKVDRRLMLLTQLATRGEGLTSTSERENLLREWATIRQDWQDDKLSDNFELHSHFIGQLFQSITALCKLLESPMLETSSQTEDDDSSANEYFSRQAKQIELLSFVCALLPNMIENMAKIRGLASFSAAKGCVQYDHDRKLRFYLQCAREQNEKIRHCAQRLHTVLGGELKAKQVVAELETTFLHFIEVVTHDVLSGQTISSSSTSLFKLATSLIDHYWSIVDEGLSLVRNWHRRDLDLWVAQ